MSELVMPSAPGDSLIRKGRVPSEGYERGSGIQFGDLATRIGAEDDYNEALQLALGRTVMLGPRLMNLYLLIRFYLPRLDHGHIIEFGSYRGGSAMFMAKLAQKYLPGIHVYALDTFAGMPATDKSIDAHNAGDFGDANIAEIKAAKDAAGLDNLNLVQGLFSETTRGVLANCGSIALAHIDCDIYGAAIYAWDELAPVMVPGGYIVFDDATESSCLGASEAVEQIVEEYGLRSEQVSPHFVFRYPPLRNPNDTFRSRLTDALRIVGRRLAR